MDYTFCKGSIHRSAAWKRPSLRCLQQQEYTYVHGESIHRKYEDILLLDDLRSFMQIPLLPRTA